MRKSSKTANPHTHPILARIWPLDKNLATKLETMKPPEDGEEFLDWWWTNLAQNCVQCVLSEDRTMVVKPDGLARAPIMIVAEGPGVMEDAAGLPMVGPLELRGSRCGFCMNSQKCWKHKIKPLPTSRPGRKQVIHCRPQPTVQNTLRQKFYLQSVGSIIDGILINRWNYTYPRHNWVEFYNQQHENNKWNHSSPWFITNTVLCRSWDPAKNADIKPGTVPKRKCRDHFLMQWAAVNPRIIVVFGRPALDIVAGASTKAASIIPMQVFNSPYGPAIFMHHPASFMREDNQNLKELQFAKVEEVLKRALDYCGFPTDAE